MRKRSLALIIILMTFLIILSVGIAGCLQGTVTMTPVQPTYQQPTKVSGSSTQSTINPTITTQPIQTFRVGDSATDGNLKLTINSIKYQDKINGFAPENKKYHYLIIDITVENLQKEKISSLWSPYSINDADGYTYSAYYISSMEKIFDGSNILPGETRRGNILFEVPIDAKGLKLKYNFGQGQIAVFNLQ